MHYTDFSEHGGPSGNLEFRFSGPGSIPNAVQQYNVLRGAELAEMRRRKERTTATPAFPVFCKVRCPGSDVTSMVTSRDVDVVTQLSLDSQTSITNADNDDENADEDIKCAMGDSVRLCGGAESPPKARAKGKGKSKASKIKSMAKSSRKVPQQQRLCPDSYPNGDFLDRLKNLHLEVCAELQTLVDEEVKKPSPLSSPRVKRVPRKLKKPNSKRQEGGGPPQQRAKTQEELSPRIVDRVFYEDYFLPQPKWVDIIPSAVMSQGIKVNVCTCPAATQQSAYKFMEQYGSLEPESLTPFFQEDSDLDHEFADRKGYLRYVEPRPRLNNDETPDNAEHGIVDPSQQLAAKPCFVELERRPHQLSLLRSLSPMRYTSQCSELAQKPAKSLAKSSPPARKAAMERGRPRRAKIPRSTTARSRPVSKLKATSAKGRLPAGSQLHPPKDPAPAPPPPPTPAPAPAAAQATMPRRQQKRRKPSPVVVYSKSLEDLKSEKQRIYNKISFTHERIIGALDKLQISLLQLPAVRQRSVQEQEKRQRNAFEFCVRFARNFLYPLKGMIDDVRLTSVANFNSAISNEACHRVMCVYGLMLQSIQTYQRQLRYFLLEKVAQKLSALIEMIYTMTNCCLDKSILARHDPVVESLLERCTRFLSFIEDMQEERSKLARETLRRRHIHPLQLGHVQVAPLVRSRRSHFQPSPRPALALRQSKQEKFRSHERYDLKMCLNDFKVYEPRVVPKERPRPCDKVFRRRRRNSQVTGTPVADPPSELHPVKDNIETQMQIQAATEDGGGDDSTSTLSLATTTAENQGNWAPREREAFPLRVAMLEAVRRATRSQLQEVLDPMMRSLKAVVNQKMSRMGDASSV